MYTIDENFAIRATSDNVDIQDVKARSLLCRVKSHDLTFKVVAPQAIFDSIHTKNVRDFGEFTM